MPEQHVPFSYARCVITVTLKKRNDQVQIQWKISSGEPLLFSVTVRNILFQFPGKLGSKC